MSNNIPSSLISWMHYYESRFKRHLETKPIHPENAWYSYKRELQLKLGETYKQIMQFAKQ